MVQRQAGHGVGRAAKWRHETGAMSRVGRSAAKAAPSILDCAAARLMSSPAHLTYCYSYGQARFEVHRSICVAECKCSPQLQSLGSEPLTTTTSVAPQLEHQVQYAAVGDAAAGQRLPLLWLMPLVEKNDLVDRKALCFFDACKARPGGTGEAWSIGLHCGATRRQQLGAKAAVPATCTLSSCSLRSAAAAAPSSALTGRPFQCPFESRAVLAYCFSGSGWSTLDARAGAGSCQLASPRAPSNPGLQGPQPCSAACAANTLRRAAVSVRRVLWCALRSARGWSSRCNNLHVLRSRADDICLKH